MLEDKYSGAFMVRMPNVEAFEEPNGPDVVFDVTHEELAEILREGRNE